MKAVPAALALFVIAGSGCSTAPTALPLSIYQPDLGTQPRAGSAIVVNEAGMTPRRSPTVVSPDVSELHEPRFADVVARDLERLLDARLNGGEPTIRATVQVAEVTVERGGSDYLPLVGGVSSTLRDRVFVATGRILFEVEVGGRVERSFTLTHSARATGRTTTDESRAAGVAAAISAFRAEAYQRIEREFLDRYL